MKFDKILDLYEKNLEKLDQGVETIREVTPTIEIFNYIKELSDFIYKSDLNVLDIIELKKQLNERFNLEKFSSCSVCEISDIVRKIAIDFSNNIDNEIDKYISDFETSLDDLDED